LLEKSIAAKAKKPLFEPVHSVTSDASATKRLAEALQHHLTTIRLADVWQPKNAFKAHCRERPTHRRRPAAILSQTLGNSQSKTRNAGPVDDPDGRVARVQALSSALAVVEDVTERLAENGAAVGRTVSFAPTAATDALLPDNWRGVAFAQACDAPRCNRCSPCAEEAASERIQLHRIGRVPTKTSFPSARLQPV
jgi:hypothetical protein